MLYPKTKKLSISNLTELRVIKMEEQRQKNLNLFSNLSRYTEVLSELSSLELKISDDLFSLYTTDSSYSGLIHKLSKAISFKSEIIKKNCGIIKDAAEKSVKLESMYETLRPLFKNYFDALDKLKHYENKVPKVISSLESKKKERGQLSVKETEKLMRNKRKLESANLDIKVIHDTIVSETDSINLKKFEILNPTVKGFISAQLGTSYLMNDKWTGIKDFEAILDKPEVAVFNDKYFLDIEKKIRSRLMKDNANNMERSAEVKDKQVYNQNVQNNYYYINQDPRIKQISQFNIEEDPLRFKNNPNIRVTEYPGQVINPIMEEIDQGIYESEQEENGFGKKLNLPLMYR